MTDILLTTLNARFIHTAFGLRCILANMAELEERSALREFDISQRPVDIAERILAEQPAIVGIGVYIWNLVQVTELVTILKRLRPELVVVLGGPEMGKGAADTPIAGQADFVITGEADLAFAELCRHRLSGSFSWPRVMDAQPPDLSRIELPYELYTSQDLAHRILYVEASRGCPFRCEFCLSSLDAGVRQIPLERFLPAMEQLLARGGRHFKFVDRSFNLDIDRAMTILHFFLERHQPGLFLHFEMIPDRFPMALLDLLGQFPAGSIQLEIGVQTLDPRIQGLIARTQDNERALKNIVHLREHTCVHIHADLILGLPGEGIESIRQGFDRLVAAGPQEIQVGILKRLGGAPISRHDAEYGMIYNPSPPYEVLQTRDIDFTTMQRLKRFARSWDRLFNSGHFLGSVGMIWEEGSKSPFLSFLDWSDWLAERTGPDLHGMALYRLAEHLFIYLTEVNMIEPGLAAQRIVDDVQRDKPRDIPALLRPHLGEQPRPHRPSMGTSGPERQARHRS